MAYIGSWPTSPGFQSVNFKQLTVTQKTETVSGRIIRNTNSTTRWTGTMSYPPMTLSQWRPIQAKLALCQGALNEFDIILPKVSENQSGNTSGLTVTVTGAHTAGDTTIVVASNKPTTTILVAGDVIRFAAHTKVYMITTDINTDTAGSAILNIQPGLVENLSNSEAVTIDNVPFRMILSNDLQEYNYGLDGTISYELDIEEVL